MAIKGRAFYTVLDALGLAAIADEVWDKMTTSPEMKELKKTMSALKELDAKLSDGFGGRNVARGADIRKREIELKVIAEGIVSSEKNKGPIVGYRGGRELEMDKATDNKIFKQNLLLMKKSKELDDLKALQGVPIRTPAARTDISAAMAATDPSTTSSSSTLSPALAPLEPLMKSIDDFTKVMDSATASVKDVILVMDEALGKIGLPPKEEVPRDDALVPGLHNASATVNELFPSRAESLVADTVSESSEDKKPTKEIKNSIQELDAVFDDLGQQTEDIFQRMALSGEVSAKSIGDSFKRLAMNTLFQQLIPAMFGLSGRATGGSMNPGTPYIVGEKGPELIIPHSGGTVKPNLKGIGGGNTTNVNQNINFTTDVKNTVRVEVLNAAPHIVNEAANAVMQNMTRGHRYI